MSHVVTPSINRILCPVDFSETSEHAVEQALAIARWCGARLTALHVYSPMFVPTPGLPAPAGRLSEPELQRARDETTRFVQRTPAPGIAVDVEVDVGRASAQILDRALSLPADMIVMGTHGAGGFERFVLGSVTEKVLRKATCPVLTVPPRAHVTSQLPFTRVLCAVDFSDWSSSVLAVASSLAEGSGAELLLLHVIEWPWHEPPPPVLTELPPAQASALAEYRRYMEKSAAGRLEFLASDPARHAGAVAVRVRHGKPYVEILRLAADESVDLIVMGVHGRNPVDLTVFGSTTNQVVRRATCPVLTLRR